MRSQQPPKKKSDGRGASFSSGPSGFGWGACALAAAAGVAVIAVLSGGDDGGGRDPSKNVPRKRPVGSMADRKATGVLKQLSDANAEYQALWKEPEVDTVRSAVLWATMADALAGIENYAPKMKGRDKERTYWGYSRARLLMEVHTDQRNFELAYAAALDAMRSPHCVPEPQCEHQVLKAALTQAYRSEKPELATKALAAWAPRPTSFTATSFHGAPQLRDPATGRVLDIESRPLWPAADLPMAVQVESHAAAIAAELQALLNPDGSFVRIAGETAYMEDRALRGFLPNARELCRDRLPAREQCWQELILYAAASGTVAGGSKKGVWNDAACKQAPRTCAALQHTGLIGEPKQAGHAGIPGKAGFIRLRAGGSIMAHVGPHNMRLTAHLGISVPESGATIHVADDVGGWIEGNVTVLDDSIVHWVHNRHPTQDRYILLWHIWHPSFIKAVGGWINEVAVPWTGGSA